MEDQRPAMDCGKTSDPAMCAAAEKAREACKGKRGAERAQCMQEKMPRGMTPGGAAPGKGPAR
jgi:hypothetical protein